MFASHTQLTIPALGDPSKTITIRMLTGEELDRAQAVDIRSAVAGVSLRRWHERVKAQMAKGTPEEKAARKELVDPLNGFGRYQLCRDGIMHWSYDIDEREVKSKGGPANKKAAEKEVVDARLKAIDDLTDEGVDYIATAILKLTKPELFLTEEESEAERKND